MSNSHHRKRKRQSETCIPCRSARKLCDKDDPCRNCRSNHRRCLYAKDFPFSHLPDAEQAVILESLFVKAKHRLELLKSHVDDEANLKEGGMAALVRANAQPRLVSSIRFEAKLFKRMRQQVAAQLVRDLPGGLPEWHISDKAYLRRFNQNSGIVALVSQMHTETAPPCLRTVADGSSISIDLARAMVSPEEVAMLVDLYNDCYLFSALPDFMSLDLDDHNDYDLLLCSVMTLMISHTVNLHAMKGDHHERLSLAFYHYTRARVYPKELPVPPYSDIQALHALFNIMLYEAENAYYAEAERSRQAMTTMIEAFHASYDSMFVWQQHTFRRLVWAIYTVDAAQHVVRLPPIILLSSYMQIDQRPQYADSQTTVERLKMEYIYYRCRLAKVAGSIYSVCHKPNAPPVSGKTIKQIEDRLWQVYNELPDWITCHQPLESVDLLQYGYCSITSNPSSSLLTSSCHPICRRSLVEVWMRRLRYHFLVEWHATWMFLYKVLLPTPGEIIELPFIRCIEHCKLMLDVLQRWADDKDFFDCYCYPSLRSLLLASHLHRYLLQSHLVHIRDKGYSLLQHLYSILQKSNIYGLYQNTKFIIDIKDALEQTRPVISVADV